MQDMQDMQDMQFCAGLELEYQTLDRKISVECSVENSPDWVLIQLNIGSDFDQILTRFRRTVF
jgi:hypothetical protein